MPTLSVNIRYRVKEKTDALVFSKQNAEVFWGSETITLSFQKLPATEGAPTDAPAAEAPVAEAPPAEEAPIDETVAAWNNS